jgi:hypothetical protein
LPIGDQPEHAGGPFCEEFLSMSSTAMYLTVLLAAAASLSLFPWAKADAQVPEIGHEVIVIEGSAPFDENDPTWIQYKLDYWAWEETQLRPYLSQINEIFDYNRRAAYDAARRRSEAMDRASNLVWTTGLIGGAIQEIGCRAWKPCGALYQAAQQVEAQQATGAQIERILHDPAATAEQRRWAMQEKVESMGQPPGPGGFGGRFGGGRSPGGSTSGSRPTDSRIGSLGNAAGNIEDGAEAVGEVLFHTLAEAESTETVGAASGFRVFDTDVFEHNAAIIDRDFGNIVGAESVGGNAATNAAGVNMAVDTMTGRIEAMGNRASLPFHVRDGLNSGQLALATIRQVMNYREAMTTGHFKPFYELHFDEGAALSAQALHNLRTNVEIMNRGEFGWLVLPQAP